MDRCGSEGENQQKNGKNPGALLLPLVVVGNFGVVTADSPLGTRLAGVGTVTDWPVAENAKLKPFPLL